MSTTRRRHGVYQALMTNMIRVAHEEGMADVYPRLDNMRGDPYNGVGHRSRPGNRRAG